MVFAWIIISVAVAIYANRLNRSGFGWFFLSLIISPLLTGILLLASGPLPKGENESVDSLANEEARSNHVWDGTGGPKLLKNDQQAPEKYLTTVKAAHDLLTRNMITQEEFSEARSEALLTLEASSFCHEPMTVLSMLLPLIDCGAIEPYDVTRIKKKLGMNEAA